MGLFPGRHIDDQRLVIRGAENSCSSFGKFHKEVVDETLQLELMTKRFCLNLTLTRLDHTILVDCARTLNLNKALARTDLIEDEELVRRLCLMKRYELLSSRFIHVVNTDVF